MGIEPQMRSLYRLQVAGIPHTMTRFISASGMAEPTGAASATVPNLRYIAAAERCKRVVSRARCTASTLPAG